MTQTGNPENGQLLHDSPTAGLFTPRFAGAGAFRLHVVVIGLAPLTLGSILVDGVPYTSSPSLLSFAALLSLLASVVFFVVGGAVTNRVFPYDGWPRTAVTVSIFGATEAIRTAVFSQTIVTSGAELEMLLPHRLLGGSMTGMLVIGIVSMLSVDRDRYYADYELLTTRQRDLTRELEALNYTISRFIDDLTTNVREVVDAALHSVGTNQRDTSTKEVVDQIVHVSENVVRPLSREVSAALPTIANSGDEAPRVSIRRVFELMTVVAPFQPSGMPLIIFMLFFSASLFLVSPETGLPLLALTVLGVWVNHFFGAKYLHSRLPQWKMRWRIIVTTLMYSLGFFVSLGAILIYRGYGTTLDRLSTLAYVLVIVSLVSWGVALIPAIREGQQEIISAMHATTASLMQVRARNEVRLRRDKQRLASIIHGDIQAILMATALKLQKDPHSVEALGTVVTQAREAIVSSFEQATSSLPTRTLSDIRQHLTDFWQGIVAVSWDIAPELHDIASGDDDLTEMLFQVLREAITNAAKHGRASNVHVDIHLDGNDHIVCRVSDNGTVHPDNESSGTGTQFFFAVAEKVTRERTPQGVVLTLIIPLSEMAQTASVR